MVEIKEKAPSSGCIVHIAAKNQIEGSGDTINLEGNYFVSDRK